MAGPESTFHCWSLINSSVLATTATFGHACDSHHILTAEHRFTCRVSSCLGECRGRWCLRIYRIQAAGPTEPTAPGVQAFTARGGPLGSKGSKWSFLPVPCPCKKSIGAQRLCIYRRVESSCVNLRFTVDAFTRAFNLFSNSRSV